MMKSHSLLIFCCILVIQAVAQKKAEFKETCISGNCKNGEGILKVAEHAYDIGSFKKGRLDGDGIHVAFFAPGAYNGYTSKETDFILQAGIQMMKPAEVLKFKPLNYAMGRFQDGQLQGNGKAQISSLSLLIKQFKGALDEQLLTINTNRFAVYEGEFINNEITGKGALTIDGEVFTVYYHPEQFERIYNDQSGLYQVTDKRTGATGYFNGLVKDGYRNGWFTTNVVKFKRSYANGGYTDELALDSGYFRALYFEDEMIGRTPPGVYPLDEAGSKSLVLSNGDPYYGPVDSVDKPNGFGMINRSWKGAWGKQENYTYIGYFVHGKKEGLGQFISYYDNKPVEWKTGNYFHDTISQGIIAFVENHGFEITSSDPKKRSIPYLDIRYRKGKFTSSGKINNYGSIGVYRKIVETGKNYQTSDYTGSFNNQEQFHGNGVYVNKGTKFRQEGVFAFGKLAEGSAKFKAEGLQEGWVIEHEGKKVCVMGRDTKTFRMKLSDGSDAYGEYTVLSYHGEGFRCACNQCGGDGKTFKRVNVPVTTHSWTRDVQTSTAVPYLNARWEGISRVTTGYTTGGYSYNTPVPCKKCDAKGWEYCKTSLPK